MNKSDVMLLYLQEVKQIIESMQLTLCNSTHLKFDTTYIKSCQLTCFWAVVLSFSNLQLCLS